MAPANIKTLANPELAQSGFEQPGPEKRENTASSLFEHRTVTHGELLLFICGIYCCFPMSS